MWSWCFWFVHSPLNSAAPGPGTMEWPPQPSLLASMIIVMVDMGNLNGIPEDRLHLSDHHFRTLANSYPIKKRLSNRCEVWLQSCFMYHWMGCVYRCAYSTTSSVTSIRPSRLSYWWADLYFPTLEKDLTNAKSMSVPLSVRKILPIHIVGMNSF